MGLAKLKSGVRRAVVLSGESLFMSSQPLEGDNIPWLRATFHLRSQEWPDGASSHGSPPMLTLLPYRKESCDYMDASRKIQENLLILKAADEPP